MKSNVQFTFAITKCRQSGSIVIIWHTKTMTHNHLRFQMCMKAVNVWGNIELKTPVESNVQLIFATNECRLTGSHHRITNNFIPFDFQWHVHHVLDVKIPRYQPHRHIEVKLIFWLNVRHNRIAYSWMDKDSRLKYGSFPTENGSHWDA